VNPRRDAEARVDGRYDARVLEPSPPAVVTPPWLADDPVEGAIDVAVDDRPVVAPVTGFDTTWDELARDDPALATWCSDRWLGAWRRLPPPPDGDAVVTTRRAWHAVAEHVVAPARHRATGKIGLRFTRGGFGTPFFPDDGDERQVRVDGTRFVVVRDGVVTDTPLTTVGTVAEAAQITPGAPTGVYVPTTPLDPSARLEIDDAAVALLGDWFGFAASLLEQVRAEAPPTERAATRLQLWPEHFDLSIDLGADDRRGTFGASPGDEAHPLPYLYVTHWVDVEHDHYWNDAAFGGASLGLAALHDADDQRAAALDFFRSGQSRLRPRTT